MNDSIASRAGMSRWFVGSSSSSRFDGMDPEQRELEPRPLAARQRSDLLERVVAAEQEPGEVRARLARPCSGIAVEQGVEDRRAGDRRAAQLGEVAELDGVAERQPARRVGGSSPAIVRRSVVLPAPFGPTIPIRSPRWAARNGDPGHAVGATVAGSPSASVAPRPGR